MIERFLSFVYRSLQQPYTETTRQAYHRPTASHFGGPATLSKVPFNGPAAHKIAPVATLRGSFFALLIFKGAVI